MCSNWQKSRGQLKSDVDFPLNLRRKKIKPGDSTVVNIYSFFLNADEIPTECSGINRREYVSYAYSLRSLYLEDPVNQHLLLCASLFLSGRASAGGANLPCGDGR